MNSSRSSIRELRAALASASDAKALVLSLAQAALACANGNSSRNTYLWRNESWTMAEAERVAAMPRGEGGAFGDGRPPLWGIPASLKDCFDLAGTPTSCGTKFYRDLGGPAAQDSWLAARLRAAGAVLTGKTHLHPLAYGITGENPDFGDCTQPGNPDALTGGSSSGAAASVLEDSAMAAIGTDTGGSVRVPAALCGLAGYRASWGRGDWRGGAHLAPSFDTFGWLFRHLEDGPLLGSIFGSTGFEAAPASGPAVPISLPTSFAVVSDTFLQDCEPAVVASLRLFETQLESLGLTGSIVDVGWWSEAMEIFAPIQASEAALIHRPHRDRYAEFEPSIRQRLEWGDSMSDTAIAELRKRHKAFRERMDALLAAHQLLVLPASPVARLAAGADHSQTRTRLLRYTSPISLSGMPTVTVPFLDNGMPAGGMQLVAAREDDARLLALGAALGAAFPAPTTSAK